MIKYLMVLVLFVGCSVDGKTYRDRVYDTAYESGQRAAKGGAEANANPYFGRDSRTARKWLDGWIDGKGE
jgi:hypothetical protein